MSTPEKSKQDGGNEPPTINVQRPDGDDTPTDKSFDGTSRNVVETLKVVEEETNEALGNGESSGSSLDPLERHLPHVDTLLELLRSEIAEAEAHLAREREIMASSTSVGADDANANKRNVPKATTPFKGLDVDIPEVESSPTSDAESTELDENKSSSDVEERVIARPITRKERSPAVDLGEAPKLTFWDKGMDKVEELR